MKYEIEITRHNVTPAAFLSYVRSQLRKHNLEDVFEAPSLDYLAAGNDLNFDTEHDGMHERSISKPYETQTYIRWEDGTVYNLMCEFDFWDEKTGTGYFYAKDTSTEAHQEAQEAQEATESESVQDAQEKPAQEAQEAQRIEIDGSATFPAPHTFWSNSPRLILNPDAIPEPIDTARNPHIAMMLRYQAEELMSSVFSDWYDDILSRDEIENDAFFTDNSLNLNNGDGYQIAENLFIDHIFAINLYGSPRGVVAVYDSDCDDFSYWLIY